MPVRIRYEYTKEPLILRSKQYFVHPTDGSKYIIELNEGDKVFKIIEDLTDTVVATGNAVNMHQVKIKAKEKLSELGISFAEETRKEKPLS